jgi:hypothetical protein
MKSIVTPEFRVSYPNLVTPRAPLSGGEPKYSLVAWFSKSTDISALRELAAAAVAEKWPDPAKRPKNLRSPFRDGDTELDKDGKPKAPGCTFVALSSKVKPQVVDQKVQPIIDVEAELYPGSYARASVVAYAYDSAGNRGVAFGLRNVQKLRDGEPLGGRSKPEDDFGPVEQPGGATKAAASDDIFAL